MNRAKITSVGQKASSTKRLFTCAPKPETKHSGVKSSPVISAQLAEGHFNHKKMAQDNAKIDAHLEKGGKIEELSGIKFIVPRSLSHRIQRQ